MKNKNKNKNKRDSIILLMDKNKINFDNNCTKNVS